MSLANKAARNFKLETVSDGMVIECCHKVRATTLTESQYKAVFNGKAPAARSTRKVPVRLVPSIHNAGQKVKVVCVLTNVDLHPFISLDILITRVQAAPCKAIARISATDDKDMCRVTVRVACNSHRLFQLHT